MQEMTAPQSNARLGYLISEMLSLPTLPADLHSAISSHLQQQLNQINILKPEYCLRLYPVLAELSQLTGMTNGDEDNAVAALETEAPVTDEAVEPASEASPAESEEAETEENVVSEIETAADEPIAAESVDSEADADGRANDSTATDAATAGVLAQAADAAEGPRTVW